MTEHRRLLTCGEHAVLVEVGGLDEVLAFTHAVRKAAQAGAAGLADVVDVVPAAATVMIVVDDDAPIMPVRQALASLPVAAPEAVPTSSQVVEIPVRYDGPDLDEVARLTGLAAQEVIAAHTGTDWRVAFCGFAPGFAYLSWGDPRLAVPRRPQPRTSVPAGSVALAGEFSAIYPRSSPGGWQLIGHTDTVVFDISREAPALLQPDVTVRFVDVTEAGDAG
jgi:KipI family sensor histidine kinase inhibitor